MGRIWKCLKVYRKSHTYTFMLSAGTAENLSFSDFKLNTNKKLLFDVGGVFTGDGYIVYAMYRRVILAIY